MKIENEKSKEVESLVPRFVELNLIAEIAADKNQRFKLKKLEYWQIEELVNNVSRELLTEESKVLAESNLKEIPIEFGNWMHFPLRNTYVQVLPKSDFIELRTCRNRLKITREEQLQLSEKSVAIIGLSAGNAVANAIVAERICGEIVLFDFSQKIKSDNKTKQIKVYVQTIRNNLMISS